MGRAPCCDKANVKKGPWSPEEDAKLKQYIEKHGTGGNWIALPQKVGLKRCGKSCRLRWLNYLRPNIKHGEFSDEEDRVIINLFANIGSRWSIIAAQLPGRTDNDIKNYWNTKLKKKLMGIINNQPPTQTQLMRKLPINTVSSTNNISSSSPYLLHPSSYITSPFNTQQQQQQSGSLIINNSSTTDHFEPNNISALNSSMNNLQVPQDQSFLSQMQHFNHQASCSSSDGSQYNNNSFHGSVEERVSNLVSSTGSVVLDYGNSSQSTGATDHYHNHHQVLSDDSVLDYGLEEIKQLISSSNVDSSTTNSSSCSNNFLFDENKTGQERVLYYYYY